jgi:sec-independent protein translocase protein TatC
MHDLEIASAIKTKQNMLLLEKDGKKTITTHVSEIKNLFLKIIGAVGAGTLVPMFFQDAFFRIVTYPLKNTTLYFTTPTDSLFFLIKIYVFFGIIITSPVIVWFLFQYFQPVLNDGEKKFVSTYLFGGILLSLVAVLYGYFSLLPISIQILLGITPQGTQFLLSADKYFDFLISTLCMLILVFQTPIIYSLIRSKLIPKSFFTQNRKMFYFALVVLLAVLTPTPDIFSLVVVALPVSILFEVALYISQ